MTRTHCARSPASCSSRAIVRSRWRSPRCGSSAATRRPRERLADDHHRARRILRDAIGRRAEQVVAEEVSAVPEHYEVVPTRRGKLRDHFRGMAGAQLDLELYPCSRPSFACLLRKPAEEEVLLAFDLFDLADRGGVGGQR